MDDYYHHHHNNNSLVQMQAIQHTTARSPSLKFDAVVGSEHLPS